MLTIGELRHGDWVDCQSAASVRRPWTVGPADVDASNGYRYYEPTQIEQARTVARLRSAASVAEDHDHHRSGTGGCSGRAPVVLAAGRSRHGLGARRRRLSRCATERPGHHHEGHHHLRPIGAPSRPGRSLGPVGRPHPRVPRLSAQITGQRLFAVADGFGDGEDDSAASTALDALAVLDGVEPDADPLGALDAAVAAGAEAVSQGKGGTTLTALLLLADRALVAHVGDSRVYRVRGGNLEQLTRDHTAVQSLVDEGRLTAHEASVDPRRVVLNRAIGPGAASAPDLSVCTIEPGDRFVLTTDGVHGVLERAELADLAVATGDPETVASAVEAAVLAAGAPDNYGIIVLDV